MYDSHNFATPISVKGELRLRILEGITSGAVGLLDIFVASLNAGYGASHAKLDFEVRKIRRERDRHAVRSAVDLQSRQRYYNMLSVLKRDGLIVPQERSSGRFFALTQKGKQRLRRLRAQAKDQLPSSQYEHISSDTFIIVAFDIPERERRKRAWLRYALRSIGLHMVQKSLWMGKVKVPQELLDGLRRLRIAQHVEIFEIRRAGTLRHVL